MRTFYKQIPKEFYNIAVAINNNLIADTNDSANWKEFKQKLPYVKTKWEITEIINPELGIYQTIFFKEA